MNTVELSFRLQRLTSLGVPYDDCVTVEVGVPLSDEQLTVARAEAEAEMDRRVAAFEALVVMPSTPPDPVAELVAVAELAEQLADRKVALVETITSDPELAARAGEDPAVTAVIDEVQAQADAPVVPSA